ncbi:hypothetical protein [Variovorax saccharolyticus]|uniref:hypothetical protein n=1 Tax=Variovorax saccharolyticus TaxID=3053516 RepID=UPI002578E395|nr:MULTISPECIES: hypothetical protein [unclassified Variovorax]MDM0018113.1 hypothetical protein [Variovorax sp. J22R187]MDM0029774.1 hypothetical protein [Variovorax sp. J31P216]
MPISFDEVSAEIEREPARGSAGDAPATAASPPPDPREQFERELRIFCERQARLSAD